MPKRARNANRNFHQESIERHVIEAPNGEMHLIDSERGSTKTMACGEIIMVTQRAGFHCFTHQARKYVTCKRCQTAMDRE